MILDSFGKFMPPRLLLEEADRLGESLSFLALVGILQFTCGVLYLIPRTAVLGAILMTGFLGGAEAIQTRVSGRRSLSDYAPVVPRSLGMGWHLAA
jgi:hypothetical protein